VNYSREDVIRILRLSPRQLGAWERSGLLRAASRYTFFDLLQVKKVRDLCARRVRPVEIRESVSAMQKQYDIQHKRTPFPHFFSSWQV